MGVDSDERKCSGGGRGAATSPSHWSRDMATAHHGCTSTHTLLPVNTYHALSIYQLGYSSPPRGFPLLHFWSSSDS